MEKYNSLAKDIIAHVGGKENITGLRHCVTRLRFNLLDEKKADDDYLKNLDGVITVMKAMGEYMVVIGEHVPYVYEEVCKEAGLDNVSTNSDEEVKPKGSVMQRILGVVMAAMGPTLNLMCACGIIKGLLVVATMVGITPESGIYALLNAAGDCFFWFMPLLLGYNVAKKLEIDPVFGFILSAALCYPAIQGIDISLFGYVVNATYTSTFLPAVFGIAIAAPLFKFFNKIIPSSFRGFATPLITLLICFPLTFIIVGPLANLIGVGINGAITFLFNISPLIAGTLLAGTWQILVLFGVHGVLVMFPFMELMQGHPSQILAFTSCVSFAQIGVVLAIYLKTKDQKLKSVALPAFISGIFGVTEPAIYGVTLPRIKMFVISCIGGAIGGLIVAITNITAYTYAGMGVVGLLGLLNPAGAEILPIALMVVIPFVFSFIVAYMMYKDDVVEAPEKIDSPKTIHQETIVSPMKGQIISLNDSNDEAFSSGALGKGVVIIPEEGVVKAPCNGTIRTLFPTKHAIGIVSEDGCEVLIHVGMNTVRLEGEGFHALVKQGDQVKVGQELLNFERDDLIAKGYDLSTPIIITNSDNYLDIVEMNTKHVNIGEELLTAIC
ncbi:beta-glucoside-specific PTS transporter subunit IIABC [[Eubacterium] hominis]|uniref:beta-glucoside-specific PTS transporter subunit IIABC n=1 Tax=[Eubacterium] hominis TaxID=2764325 RepID=UPI003A4D6EC9